MMVVMLRRRLRGVGAGTGMAVMKSQALYDKHASGQLR
jgi:hypothetical protein